MLFVIGNKNFSVAVDSLGAQLNSIKKDGKEKLWQNEDGSWEDHAPLLFPYCGRFNVKSHGKVYPNDLHGFAQYRDFTLVSQTETELCLNLVSDAETLKVYPFEFSLNIRYRVVDTSLEISCEVKNIGKEDLYFATGGHESYAIDEELAFYHVEFEKEEELLRLFHDDDGVLTDETKVYPKSKNLYFSEVPIISDETLIFKGIKSSWCKLVKNSGEVVAKTEFSGLNNIMFWRTPGARFICMEPWMNMPAKKYKSDAEIPEIENVEGFIRLKPNQERSVNRKITY